MNGQTLPQYFAFHGGHDSSTLAVSFTWQKVASPTESDLCSCIPPTQNPPWFVEVSMGITRHCLEECIGSRGALHNSFASMKFQRREASLWSSSDNNKPKWWRGYYAGALNGLVEKGNTYWGSPFMNNNASPWQPFCQSIHNKPLKCEICWPHQKIFHANVEDILKVHCQGICACRKKKIKQKCGIV